MKIKQKRFDNYDPFDPSGNPETIGLLASEKDWDLGMPNIDRSENITFVAAHSSLKQAIILRFKWRPDKETQTVTVFSRLSITLNEDLYEFEQVESYKPVADSLRKPGRISQYGSGASKLKLVIQTPYRRSRLLFNGHLRHVQRGADRVGTDEEPRLVFMKLNCLILPVTEIFDFLENLDENCLKQIYIARKPALPLASVIKDLVLHDRHEQRVQIIGDCLLIDDATQPAVKAQEIIDIRGYHSKHFLTDEKEFRVETARLYAYANNGQGFHIGVRKSDNVESEFGYTAFRTHPEVDFIDKPFKIDNRLESDLRNFNLEVSGQQSTFTCTGERQLLNWFKLDFNGKPGWAWLNLDDELVETQEELTAAERCRSGQRSLAELGRMCVLEEPSADEEPLIVSIDDELCGASALVGAKAASLAQLHKFSLHEDYSKYKVPHAIILTRFAHDLVLKENTQLPEAINELLQSASQRNKVQERCARIKELISNTSLPSTLADQLWQKLTAVYHTDDQVTFAVRSSSWGEDEADMSAAGQLSTILNVEFKKEKLAEAVMACFASKFSPENIEYKRQHGQPLDLPMAVVVQRMISCDQAGVMFTCDPTNGNESSVTITANYGLGESVVSGKTEPDTVKVRVGLLPRDYSLIASPGAADQRRSLKIEEVQVGKKEIIMCDGDGSRYDKSRCCLSDEQILHLAQCGLEIKQYFWSQRRDIEWGFKDGQLHLFQSRPVTGLDSYTETELIHEFDKSSAGELKFFTRANVGEVMPHAIKPLTLSFLISSWTILGYKVTSRFLYEPTRFAPQINPDFSCQKYHSLFSVANSMFLSVDNDKKSVLQKSLEIGLLGREIGPRPDIVEASRGFTRTPQPFEGFWFKLKTWQLRLMPVWTVERDMPAMKKLRDEVVNLKYATGYESNKLLGLYNQMCATLGVNETSWKHHISVIVLASNSNVILTAILSKYIHDAKQLCAATNRFLAISPDVVSAEIPKRVRKIAELVKEKSAQEFEAFLVMQPEEAYKKFFVDVEPDDPVRVAFEEFMSKFGHRCYNEFEIANPAWRENPTQVVDMIQRNCLALKDGKEEKKDDRDKTIDDVIKSLQIDLSFMDWLLIKRIYAPKSQLFLSLREKTKTTLIYFADIVRQCSRMLAAELVRQQRIPDEDLLYYIAFDELKPLCLDYQPAVVMQAVRRRQLFKKFFSEIWKFDEIFTECIPNHLKPTRELEEAIAQAPRLTGTPASSGKVQGRVCRIETYKELNKVRPGTILLTHSTDIAFSPVFPMISGIITEVGGLVSHGAVVAREYGLPSLIGIPDVMRILQDDEEIILDADNGTIIRLSKASG